MGDDTVVVFDGFYVDIEQYESIMGKCGMSVKASYGDIQHVKFCSSMFIPCKRTHDNVDTHLMCPLPGRQLIKSGCSIHKYIGKAALDWVATNALAMRQDYTCIPYISCFYDKVFKNCKGKVRSNFVEKHWSTEYSYIETAATTDWLCKRYGYTYDDLLNLKKTLNNLEPDFESQYIQPLYEVDIDEIDVNPCDLSALTHMYMKPIESLPPKEFREVIIKPQNLKLELTNYNDKDSTSKIYINKNKKLNVAIKLNEANPHHEKAQEIANKYGVRQRVFNKIRSGFGQRHNRLVKSKIKPKKYLAAKSGERRKSDFVSRMHHNDNLSKNSSIYNPTSPIDGKHLNDVPIFC